MLRVLSDPRFATLEAALGSLRQRFADAVAGQGGAPDGNTLAVGPTEIRVDQVRRIAAMVAGPHCWTHRDGLWLARNDEPGCRMHLAYVVGRSRLFSAGDFVHVLTLLGAGGTRHMRSDDLAMFVNLVVAEPGHDPACELPIWVAVAHELASGEGDDEQLAQRIPELITGHDPLHAEIPEGAEYAEPLLPESETPLEPTLRRYEARLLSEVLPGATGPFAAHRDALEAYVGEHVLSRAASS